MKIPISKKLSTIFALLTITSAYGAEQNNEPSCSFPPTPQNSITGVSVVQFDSHLPETPSVLGGLQEQPQLPQPFDFSTAKADVEKFCTTPTGKLLVKKPTTYAYGLGAAVGGKFIKNIFTQLPRTVFRAGVAPSLKEQACDILRPWAPYIGAAAGTAFIAAWIYNKYNAIDQAKRDTKELMDGLQNFEAERARFLSNERKTERQIQEAQEWQEARLAINYANAQAQEIEVLMNQALNNRKLLSRETPPSLANVLEERENAFLHQLSLTTSDTDNEEVTAAAQEAQTKITQAQTKKRRLWELNRPATISITKREERKWNNNFSKQAQLRK